MKLVNSVDGSLLDIHKSLIMESLLLANPADPKTIRVLLDIILIRHSEDGTQYAASVLELIRNVDKSTSKPRVSKEIIENVLTNLRTSCEKAGLLTFLLQLNSLQQMMIS